MKPEFHLQAFQDRKETIFRWGLEVKGLEKAQRVIGDNASRAIIELLSAYLHQQHLVEEGFQLNHAWFKSEKVFGRLPEFSRKQEVVSKLIQLEKLCENLSYGAPKPAEKLKEAIVLFQELEELLSVLQK